ncbi:MAG: MBL fold metallo-hydrolase [Deltaproteobacteria bacterium]|jgi:phosphoribosyl 1,2-cyclic phosphodiesterase|nr:MBL fold metallo-hydrolase [Deltaproteobacteria bacterium]
MIIRFWGVRGSLPSPAGFSELKEKITRAVDLALRESPAPESAAGFVARLPERVTSFVGGNTPCLEISCKSRILIFDAGSGIRNLGAHLTPSQELDIREELQALGKPGAKGESEGKAGAKPKTASRARARRRHLDLLFTHTHWDHIQGFPFFAPAYDKDTSITIHAANTRAVEDGLRAQQSTPLLFPIHFDELPADIRFRTLTEDGLKLGPFEVEFMRLPHPGGSTAYRIRAFGHTVVFATDYELLGDGPEINRVREDMKSFIQAADVFISDTQYTYLESHSKEGWGHSNALNVVEMAHAAGVKRLYLFHHDPSNSDGKLYDMLEKAASYSELLFPGSGLSICLATEGTALEFPEHSGGSPRLVPHDQWISGYGRKSGK